MNTQVVGIHETGRPRSVSRRSGFSGLGPSTTSSRTPVTPLSASVSAPLSPSFQTVTKVTESAPRRARSDQTGACSFSELSHHGAQTWTTWTPSAATVSRSAASTAERDGLMGGIG